MENHGEVFFYDPAAKFNAHDVMFHKTPAVFIPVHYFDVITTKCGFEKL